MELKGAYSIPAPREVVWDMLNDPDILRACLPGCESLEGSAAEGFSARVTTKIGPVKATFNGSVTLSNVNPPEGYTICGEGKGGVAGFAKGGGRRARSPRTATARSSPMSRTRRSAASWRSSARG